MTSDDFVTIKVERSLGAGHLFLLGVVWLVVGPVVLVWWMLVLAYWLTVGLLWVTLVLPFKLLKKEGGHHVRSRSVMEVEPYDGQES